MGYWHESALLEATLRPGRQGVPRLYNWVDYLRLQLAAQLSAEEVPTQRIRVAVAFLDRNFAEWYLLPDSLSASPTRDVAASVIPDEAPLLANLSGQHLMKWPDPVEDLKGPTLAALETITARGPLGQLHRFGDVVTMSPRITVAQPTVVGTALETRFISLMANDIGCTSVASMYSLDTKIVERSIEFEGAVA